METRSKLLTNCTGVGLNTFINNLNAEVVIVLTTSRVIYNSRTGKGSADYLIIYKYKGGNT